MVENIDYQMLYLNADRCRDYGMKTFREIKEYLDNSSDRVIAMVTQWVNNGPPMGFVDYRD